MAISARRTARAEQQAGVVRFLRETLDELRKVVWPTPQELYRYTLVVVVTVVAIGGFIFLIDQSLHFLAGRWVYGGSSG